jgi:hypothetical protein
MTAYLLSAIICAIGTTDCVPVTVTVRPGEWDLLTDWCDRYAETRAEKLAEGFVPSRVAEVQPGSVTCRGI